jgi:hypothetical protein
MSFDDVVLCWAGSLIDFWRREQTAAVPTSFHSS